MNRMIALWAHPRSRSTALERVFIERGDFNVFHEPFAHVMFDEHSAIPFDDLNDGLPRSYESIKQLLRSTRDHNNVFHKDMCYHCLDELKRDAQFLCEQQHVFIIREPVRTIRSHHAIYPQMSLQSIGHQAMYEVFCRVTRLSGKIPYVINADEFALRPENTVRRLCDYLQLEFLPHSLLWEQRCPPQWLAWRSWHRDAELSRGINPPSTDVFDEQTVLSDPRLSAYYQTHLPY
jgi:hypothetical protein